MKSLRLLHPVVRVKTKLWELTHICNLTLLSCLKTVFTLKSIPTVLTKAEVKESSAYLGGEMMSADLFTHLHYHLTGIGRKFCPPSCCLWSTVWTCNQSSGLQRLSAMIVLPLPSRNEQVILEGWRWLHDNGDHTNENLRLFWPDTTRE